MKKEEITGIIVAGGRNSRMAGYPKGLLRSGDSTFIEKIIANLKPLVSNILISSNDESYSDLGYSVVNDVKSGQGPLGGISSALVISPTQKNLIVACDMPFVTVDLFRKLLSFSEDYDCVVPVSNGLANPLCAFYAKKALPMMQTALEENHLKMQEIVKRLNTFYLILDKYEEKELLNINSIAEYDQIKNKLK